MSLKLRQLAKISAVTATALCAATVVAPSQANAFELNGWDYTVAAKGNGTGGSVFDYGGMAVKDSGDSITVAINANMNLQGHLWNNDEIINHGDLFFNFTGKSFKEASDAGELVAINFARTGSQTGAGSRGVYAGVSAKNTTRDNYGWNNLNGWKNAVNGNNSYGDLTSDSSYFAGQHTGTRKILNAIDTGTKVGDIEILWGQDLKNAGLDAKQFGAWGERGTKTFGFTFKKTEHFKAGSYIANLFMECGNDGVALASALRAADKKVPEPTVMLGLAGVSGLGLMRRRRRQRRA